jgi:tetratricopeptide (TPR) repeat protein
MRHRLDRLAGAVALAWAVSPALAAHIDQIDVRREGADAVIAIKFDTEVQFQRALDSRAKDFVVITYNLLSRTNQEIRGTQGRRLGAAEGVPELRLTDEADEGTRRRRMVLRFAEGVPTQVRAGAGNQSIEIVLLGRGAALARTAQAARTQVTPATLPGGERRFVIVLGSSDTPDFRLPRTIPASLQDYSVSTESRVVDGKTRYEVQVGFFSTRTQAEAVLKQLSGFPGAEIVALAPPAPAAPPVASGPTPAPTTPPPAVTAPVVPAVPATPPVAVAPAPAAPAPAAPAPAAAAPAPAPAAAPPAVLTAEEVESRAATLIVAARATLAQGNTNATLETLGELLDLPPNRQTAEAQEMAGRARLAAGDSARARIEFETYLKLYPNGPAARRVREELAKLPAAPAPTAPGEKPGVETTVTGSASMYYYGGNGQTRSQTFQDSPIAGLPQVVGDELLTPDKSRQIFNDVDLNWRRRDNDSDLRFAFRDSYTTDLERSEKSKNRLSALYLDYKSLVNRYGVRLGRQSPTGGGVMGRFDGVQGYGYVAPKVKLGAVAGVPTDKFFDSKRKFYGASIDAEQIVPSLGGAFYAIEQKIDGEVDRRAVGLEARYFKGGASSFAQADYDVVLKTWNIAAIQGTYILEDNTVITALYDRRALPMVTLGNSLTFVDPSGILFTKLSDKLATTTIDALRDQVRRTTPFVTQAQFGVTKPINPNWQVGASAQLTKVGEIPPVPDVPGFENGRPATGNLYSATGQVIGLNLFSPRDTHVFTVTLLSKPAVKGVDGYILGYNHSSLLWDVWQFEPSIQYYNDKPAPGATSDRWSPGLRLTYRGFQRWAIETAVNYEIGKSTRQAPDPIDPTLIVTTRESSTRVNYSLGARFEF